MGLIFHGSYSNGFAKKKSCLGQMGYLGPRMVHPHNSVSAVRIVLQFCTVKSAKRDKEIFLMVFLKEMLLRAICSFWNENDMASS